MGFLNDHPDISQGLLVGDRHQGLDQRPQLGKEAAGNYPGPWFPEPLLGDPYQDPERSAELATQCPWLPWC